MSTIYRYKNCVIFNLWNYHLQSDFPEIKMHAICIMNVITNRLRIWNKEHYKNDKYFPREEITSLSEKTKLHILEEVFKLVQRNSSQINPTGVHDLPENSTEFDFMLNNYVGDISANPTELKNQYEEYMNYLKCNCNEKITKTQTIDPYYFQRF